MPLLLLVNLHHIQYILEINLTIGRVNFTFSVSVIVLVTRVVVVSRP
jgi:hypothetical protein